MKYPALFGLLALLAGAAQAAEPTTLTGAVAYTEIIRFDYAKDGKKARVQFWLDFTGKAAIGKEGEPGYRPAEGSISYYLLDVDKQQRVKNWLMGFSMMSEPVPSGPYPITNLVIEGNTARFEAFDRKWILTDGGQGFEKDRVVVDDGFKPKPMKMYDGDIKISAP